MCLPSAVSPLLLLILTIGSSSCIRNAAADTARAECVCVCTCMCMPVCVCVSSFLDHCCCCCCFYFKIWAETKAIRNTAICRIKNPNTFLWPLFKYLDQADHLNSHYIPLSFKSINLDSNLAKSKSSGNITSCGQWNYF